MEPNCTDWSVTHLLAWISSDSRAGGCPSICEGPVPARAASSSSFCFECLWGFGTKPRGAAEVSPPAGNLCPSHCPLSLASASQKCRPGSCSLLLKAHFGITRDGFQQEPESFAEREAHRTRWEVIHSKAAWVSLGVLLTGGMLFVGLERSFPHILKTGKSWSRRFKGKPSGTRPLKVVIP